MSLRAVVVMWVVIISIFCVGAKVLTHWIEKDCASHNAKPKYVYGLQYVCVTSDGRIVQ